MIRARHGCFPAGPGFTVKRPIRKEYLGTPLHSLLILVLLASRIWRALHESVNFVHDPEKQYKSLSVAHRPGGPVVHHPSYTDDASTFRSRGAAVCRQKQAELANNSTAPPRRSAWSLAVARQWGNCVAWTVADRWTRAGAASRARSWVGQTAAVAARTVFRATLTCP